MKTGIVILNYNDSESTITLTDSIMSYDSIDNIMIVDNRSKDDSFNVLSERYKDSSKVSVVLSEKNGGYSYGNNFGARKLINEFGCECIIIANPDVLFEEKLITGIKDTFEENPQYGVLSGVMTLPNGETDKAPYRDLFSYWHDVGDCFILIRRLVYEKQVNVVDYSKKIMDVDVIQGSFFAITAKAFCDIDGLDENVFLYCEELILGKRLIKAGYKTGLITELKYIHNHSVSINKSMKKLAIWKRVIASKYYYQKYYNNVGPCGLMFLKLCQGISVAVKFVIDVL